MQKRNIDLLREARSKIQAMQEEAGRRETALKVLVKECDALKCMVTDFRTHRDELAREEKGIRDARLMLDALLLGLIDRFGKDGVLVLRKVDLNALKDRAVLAGKEPDGGIRIEWVKRHEAQ